MQNTYIEKIILPGTQDGSYITVAKPLDNQYGTITVICGENGCGKSFVLRELRAALQSRWPTTPTNYIITKQGLQVFLENEIVSPPKVLSLTGTWKYKDKAGVIPLERNHKKQPNDIPDYELCFLCFAARQVNCHLSKNQQVPIDFWPSEPKKRKESVESLELEHKLYLTSRTDKTVGAIEKSLGASLYFRKTGVMRNNSLHLELVLVYGDGAAIPFTRWSDGQRAVCYLAIMLAEVQPSVLLLDEIENHLHPTYMTQTLMVIRENVSQSLVSTHHPHVIFSELINQVAYIETARIPAHKVVPLTLDYRKVDQQPAPPRYIRTLSNSFEKLTTSYKLFHGADKQLLRQAALIRSEVDIQFYEKIIHLFAAGPVSTKKSQFADPQAGQLIDSLNEILLPSCSNAELSVLDFGAGVGRLPLEVAKIIYTSLPKNITWYCWEPDLEPRQKLHLNTAKSPNIHVIEDCEFIEPKVDICVMANLIHELTPQQVARALSTALNSITPKGVMVILEIYPLLHAEHLAVSYPRLILCDLLRTIGLSVRSTGFSVRDVDAYIVTAEKKGQIMDIGGIVTEVEKTWYMLRRSAIQSYAARKGVYGIKGYVELLHELSTIASVTAYQEKEW